VTATGDIEITGIRADGTAVPDFTSGTSGNVVTVKVPSGALMPGLVRFVVKLISGGVKTTILAVVGTVVSVSGSQYVDTGNVIPDLQDWLDSISDIQVAATDIRKLSISASPISGDRYQIAVTKTS
jgi:hypothetical protein